MVVLAYAIAPISLNKMYLAKAPFKKLFHSKQSHILTQSTYLYLILQKEKINTILKIHKECGLKSYLKRGALRFVICRHFICIVIK